MLTRSDVAKGHPEYYQDMAADASPTKRPAPTSSTSSAIPTIRLAHEFGTGPEILRQMDGELDAIVFGCGSSGTMTGLSRCFAEAVAARPS